jgi:hypothetical protein
MNPSSSNMGVLCQSRFSGETNGEHAGNDDEEFLEDRAANQGRHILNPPNRPRRIALTHYRQV